MKICQFIIFALLFITAPVQADVMLLIHGFLGSAFSWEKSGVNQELQRLGWMHAGTFEIGPYGPQLLVTQYNGAANKVYTATLPSETPVMIQADVLKSMIDILQLPHPGEPVILVGHSAGGVVARAYLVRYQPDNIKGLITVATPNVGTGKAKQALAITRDHGPFDIIKEAVGGDSYDDLKHSRGLLYDLEFPRPGNLLYWLNSQPHPDIHYASIIRINKDGEPGDKYVPGFSQNLNNVPALMGKSSVIITMMTHSLTSEDALTIVSLINHWQ